MGRRDPASVLRLIIEKPGCARSDSRTWCGRHPRRWMLLVVRLFVTAAHPLGSEARPAVCVGDVERLHSGNRQRVPRHLPQHITCAIVLLWGDPIGQSGLPIGIVRLEI